MFQTDELVKRVSLAIAESDIPVGHNKAFVLAATSTGVKGVVSIKIRDTWQIDTIFTTDYHGDMEGGIVVKGSWK
jgi:hypothetical protein